MASADEYATWIVEHQAEQGSPDFEIVARAYQEAKAAESMPTPTTPTAAKGAPPRSLKDELARQAGLTGRYLIEGAASPLVAMANPINALFHLPSPGPALSGLLSTAGFPQPEGKKERIVGDVSKALSATGGTLGLLGGLQNLATGPVATRVLSQLTGNVGAQAGGAIGAGAAGGATRESGAPPWAQWLASLGGGFVGAMAPSLAVEATKAAGRFLGATAAPFTKPGQQKLIGNTLYRLANRPQKALENLQDVPTYVEGSEPTTAQAARDPGLSQLERGLANQSPEFARRYAEQNAARANALGAVAGTPVDLQAAIAARETAANAQYGAARATPLRSDVSIDKLVELTKRPAFEAATKRAQAIAMNEGIDLKDHLLDNPTGLHYIKMALDDMIGEGKRQGLGAAQQRAIIGVQKAFLDWLDKASPLYAQARQNYAAASGPIGQMETLQGIQQATQNAAPSITGEQIISQAKWQNVVTRRLGDLEKVLPPAKVEVLKNIGADLDRGTASLAGKAVGSNTIQNLTTANVLGSVMGKTTPTNSMILQTMTRPLQWIYKIPEERMQEILVDAMLDPAVAKLMLSKATMSGVASLSTMLANRYMAMLRGAAIGSTAFAR